MGHVHPGIGSLTLYSFLLNLLRLPVVVACLPAVPPHFCLSLIHRSSLVLVPFCGLVRDFRLSFCSRYAARVRSRTVGVLVGSSTSRRILQ